MVAMLACLAGLTFATLPPPQNLNPDPRMTWWREARFGMFIHWGLYSVLAGEWQGNKGHAEWIRETAHIPIPEYEKLLDRFNPVKFDADAWVKMAKDAGMKYIVITSKHHDGFCLFDSANTDWDVMSTPFQRDILKELSDACRRQGVVFCTYHSIMDWHNQDYTPKRAWEGETWRDAKVSTPDLSSYKPDFDKFNTYLRSEVAEVITKYKPAVMWFDGEWESTWNHRYGKPLYDLCLATDPKIIVNNRVDVYRAGMEGMTSSKEAAGDFGTPEQTIPATGLPGVDWETCMTMNDHWGFNAADKNFKTTRSMIRMISDVASKGGNYLLNIGPRADGTFPPESVQRLKEIGMWMRTNGEAVYGTQASPFKNLPWGRATMKPKGKKTAIYLHVFDWPTGGKLTLSGLGSRVTGARLLGGPRALKVGQGSGEVAISVPAKAPDPDCSVIALEIAGKLDLVDGEEGGIGLGRHRLDGADAKARGWRNDLFLAGDQGDLIGADPVGDPVVDFPGEQAERQPDNAGRMTEHPLNRQMGLAGIGRSEDRDKVAPTVAGGACSGRDAHALRIKLRRPLRSRCAPIASSMYHSGTTCERNLRFSSNALTGERVSNKTCPNQ